MSDCGPVANCGIISGGRLRGGGGPLGFPDVDAQSGCLLQNPFCASQFLRK